MEYLEVAALIRMNRMSHHGIDSMHLRVFHLIKNVASDGSHSENHQHLVQEVEEEPQESLRFPFGEEDNVPSFQEAYEANDTKSRRHLL